MNKQELLKLCEWDDYEFANLNIHSDLFDQTIPIRFIPGWDSGRVITDQMVGSLNDFLQLTADELDRVKELLWEDCKKAFVDIDYGCEPLESESNAEANHREFNIHNPDDAFNRSDFIHITIRENQELKNRYSAIDFVPPWEDEHGVSIVVKNGKLIDTYSNDAPFGRYESDAYR